MSLAVLLAVALALLYRSSHANPNSTVPVDQSAAIPIVLTCSKLQERFGPSMLREDNWSQTAWRHPSCIVTPTTTQETAAVLRVLVDHHVPFAIRSGGHSPNPSDSNIDGGALLSLSSLNKVSYDVHTGLVSLGPGARWEAVYTELDRYNRSMVGGRVLDVGVGGLALGSGLSHLTDLYGLVCDNIISYEVILADGRVVEASTRSHPDLFWALKGGSNNFGIVTNFVAKTYSIYHGWGGIQVFTPDQMPLLLQALYKYQTTPDKDPYANLFINLVPTNGSLVLSLIYLKPVERPPAYAPFYALTPVYEQTDFMTLHQLMALFPPTSLPRWSWYTQGFTPQADLYDELASLWTTAPELSTVSSVQAGTLIAAIHPISASAVLAQASGNSGGSWSGNALGLRPVNQTWWTLTAGWYKAEDDATVYGALESLSDKIRAAADAAGASLDYIFMNEANSKQKVVASYGDANVRRLREVQRVYDPQQVFQRLVPGGQKLA
ncbi:putative FAD-binding oxidoreductase [Xylariaceae sp. FL0594]|nr:putative FAD-binding oxidoreductase [Xylariaceae sp. FL0594]